MIKLNRLMAALATLVVALSAMARDFTYQGLTYTVIDENAKTCQTRAGGKKSTYTDSYLSPGNDVRGELIIPATVSDGSSVYSVIGIGGGSFYECSDLTSVTIPNSIRQIGKYAFFDCTGLNGVHINSIEAWCEIEFENQRANPLYYAKNLYLNGVLVRNVTIPNSVMEIGNNAFSGCTSLASINIPNSVMEIGDNAFSGCTSLTNIVLPPRINAIGNYTFYGCTNLASINIPITVRTIGDCAFALCSSLTSINIPSSVRSIKATAFLHCIGLTAVYINSIEAWCNIEFEDKYSTNPLCYAKELYINDVLTRDVVIPPSITKIRTGTFSSFSGLRSVKIPDSVTQIEEYAFCECTSLENIVLPNSVTQIGRSTFYGCHSLSSVTIPNSVTQIGENAFSSCHSLSSVTIPNSVTQIGENAFYDSPVDAVYINSVEAWCRIAFANDYSNPIRMAKNLYLNGELLCDLVIPNTITEIGDYTFYECPHITSVTIPLSLKKIGEGAFWGCAGVKAVNISSIESWCNIEFVGYSANPLGYAHNLYVDGELVENVVIPNTVTQIWNSAFDHCYSLKTVAIPNSVTQIGGYAFAFCNIPNITIPNSVTQMGEAVFFYCEKLQNVVLPNNITCINKWLFEGCKSLTSVTIPNSVTTIDFSAFFGCGLTSVIIPNSVTTIGDSAFGFCAKLTKLIIGDSVTKIGDNAFINCFMSNPWPGGGNNIYSLNTTPPEITEDTFDSDSFNYVTLHVKPEALKAYKEHEYWGKFVNISTDMSSGIDEITAGADGEDADASALYYNMQGQLADPHTLCPGQLYIRCQGGKSTKFIAQ